jgi:hypothetical protein
MRASAGTGRHKVESGGTLITGEEGARHTCKRHNTDRPSAQTEARLLQCAHTGEQRWSLHASMGAHMGTNHVCVTSRMHASEASRCERKA